ncbi:hypothetical protein F4825DRAFT_440984 [Nemania diffusa]|nr:hypothetical protein F4825DRAFT_440984 [Nemania diffusa]
MEFTSGRVQGRSSEQENANAIHNTIVGEKTKHQWLRSRVYRKCSASWIFADVAAALVSGVCATLIARYDVLVSRQNEIKNVALSTLSYNMHRLGLPTDASSLNILTPPTAVGLMVLYTLGIITMYCLHQNDKYLILWLASGGVGAVVVSLWQNLDLESSIVQIFPSAMVVSLFLSACFHYWLATNIVAGELGDEYEQVSDDGNNPGEKSIV